MMECNFVGNILSHAREMGSPAKTVSRAHRQVTPTTLKIKLLVQSVLGAGPCGLSTKRIHGMGLARHNI